jgi:hypothetical protein
LIKLSFKMYLTELQLKLLDCQKSKKRTHIVKRGLFGFLRVFGFLTSTGVHKIQHYIIHTLLTNETVRLMTIIDRSQGRQNYELFEIMILIIWCSIPLTNSPSAVLMLIQKISSTSLPLRPPFAYTTTITNSQVGYWYLVLFGLTLLPLFECIPIQPL